MYIYILHCEFKYLCLQTKRIRISGDRYRCVISVQVSVLLPHHYLCLHRARVILSLFSSHSSFFFFSFVYFTLLNRLPCLYLEGIMRGTYITALEFLI